MKIRRHHHAGRTARSLRGLGAILVGALLVTQALVVLAVPASGDQRGRDGAFESDTTVISDGATEGASQTPGLSTRTAPAPSPADEEQPPPDGEPSPCEGDPERRGRRCEETGGGITIEKTANVEGSVGIFESFSFTITLTNGGEYGQLVHVSDTIPDGLVLEGSNCGYEPRLRFMREMTQSDPQTVECTVLVDPEGPTTITVWVHADGSDCHPVNTASFEVVDGQELGRAHTAQQGDGSSGQASADVHVDCPRVELDKSVDVSRELQPGEVFHYTITISNGGDGEGGDSFSLGDSFPYGITVTDVSSSSFDDQSLNCYEPDQAMQNGGLSCYGFIEEGETITIVITAYANGEVCGQIDNTAFLRIGREQPESATAPAEGDPNPFQMQDSATIFVRCLFIDKTANPDFIAPLGSFDYTIEVTNLGVYTRYGLQISDALPAEVAFDGLDVSDPQNVSCQVQGNAVLCAIDALPGGSSVSVTIHVHHVDGCEIRNRATLSARAFEEERSIQDDEEEVLTELPVSDSAGVRVACAGEPGPPPPPPPAGQPDLELAKTGPETAHVGDTITYTFTVTIGNDVPVTDVTVEDAQCDMPPALADKLGGDDDDTLEPGEIWVYTCTHLVTDADADPLVNTATATAEGGGTVDSDDASTSTDILHPAIDVEVTPDPTSGGPGEAIRFTFVVTNTGDTPLSDVTLDDDLFDDFGGGAAAPLALAPASSLPDLAVGEHVSFTRTWTLSGQRDLADTADAAGTDPLGLTVTDRDRASVNLVLGATVTPTRTPPGGIAFTGSAAAVPLAGLALVFLVAGTGLLWVSRRLRHRPAHAGRQR